MKDPITSLKKELISIALASTRQSKKNVNANHLSPTLFYSILLFYLRKHNARFSRNL